MGRRLNKDTQFLPGPTPRAGLALTGKLEQLDAAHDTIMDRTHPYRAFVYTHTVYMFHRISDVYACCVGVLAKAVKNVILLVTEFKAAGDMRREHEVGPGRY
jgi:hypothetical protein